MSVHTPSPLRGGSGSGRAVVGLDPAALDRMMPLHVVVGMDGAILHAGRTLRKLRPDPELVGAPFLMHFDVRRPRDAESIADLAHMADIPLRLCLRDPQRTTFKAQAVPLSNGRALLIDLSFGISAVEAVQRFRLTSADFAATDLTVEMLYLVEAQKAALEETRRLNNGRQRARRAADQDASTDRLTGARKRRAMEHMLIRLVGQGTPFGLMHVGLENFEQLETDHGTEARDDLLCATAAILQDRVRSRDMVARADDHLFGVVLHGMTHNARLTSLAERIAAAFAAPILTRSGEITVRPRLGIAISTLYSEPDATTMLSESAAALELCLSKTGSAYEIARIDEGT